MELFVSLFIGAIVGYLYVKSIMEKRLYLILTKMGINSTDVDKIMSYYKNYSKIQKETAKRLKDINSQLDLDYSLRQDSERKDKANRL